MKRKVAIPDRSGMLKRHVFEKDKVQYVQGDVIKKPVPRHVTLSDGQIWDRAYSPIGKQVSAIQERAWQALEVADRLGYTKRNPQEWERLRRLLTSYEC